MYYLLSPTSAIYTAAALIPAIVLLVYIYRHDKIEKEPPSLLALLLIVGGGASVVLSLIGENVLQGVLDFAVNY